LLRTGDHQAIWQGLHPQAQRADGQQAFMEALSGMRSRLSEAEPAATIDDVHFVDVHGGVNDLARVQCETRPGDPNGFSMLLNAGDEDVGVVNFEIAGEVFSYAATVQLRKRGEAWRLVGIQVNPASYRGRSAAAFETMADAYARQQKIVAAYLALGVAQTLSSRGSLAGALKERVNTKLEKLRNDQLLEAQLGVWEIDGKSYDMQAVALASTRSDISAVFKYVTPGGLVAESLEQEANALLAHVKARFPELTEQFDAVVFEAYAEAPDEPGKRYDAYRVARYLDGRQDG
jgi:hypothetical protein